MIPSPRSYQCECRVCCVCVHAMRVLLLGGMLGGSGGAQKLSQNVRYMQNGSD